MLHVNVNGTGNRHVDVQLPDEPGNSFFFET